MNRAQIDKINIERLTRWKNRLNEQHSTPMLLIGVGHDHKLGQLAICVTEDRSNQEILLLLKEAVQMMEQANARNN